MSRVAALLFCLAHLVSAAPPCYKKADTWQETLRLSREALTEKEAGDAAEVPPKGFKPGLATLRFEAIAPSEATTISFVHIPSSRETRAAYGGVTAPLISSDSMPAQVVVLVKPVIQMVVEMWNFSKGS